ncbi:4-hydroxy-tetrahydrodipicolinate synthase [Zhongshania aliphaticivorans]|uniref:4-hydroxy-tetrahydrodipicolinate synthase n=1 Tax=Zhongshania aliphaticivorans TaxID=1470434 RepID=A0A5S9Q9V6_9GAMM|nr:dihydrodipicolinate synthase family protein [Zhongshania aliphaticivorans]CAA0102760.1 4-hydroxy-tetrahydrodipicolinate synthase [Zhongshania aliphaticivorans]CAA0113922.1 4-hydroxy-tetrahydrodipicolinate synthase [Zhongshania aliphaticivorans]
MINGIIVDLITPTHADGSPDYETVEILVDWHVTNGSTALIIGSSTGHPAYMNTEERTELLRRAIWQADSRIPIIADLSSDTIDHAFELADVANEYGASAVLITAPTDKTYSENELIEHFQTLAKASQCPAIIRAESNLNNLLAPESIAELAQSSSINGYIDGSMDNSDATTLLGINLPQDFTLYAGHDASACQQLLAGYGGSVSISANVNPVLLNKLFTLTQSGDSAAAEALDAHLQTLYSALLEDPNSIPIKWALVEMGCIPESENPPVLTQASDYSNLRRALRAAEIPI